MSLLITYSAVSALLFAFQAAGIEPNRVSPVETFDCKLRDPSDQAHKLSFRVTGGMPEYKDDKFLGWSKRKVEILNDPSNILTKYPDQDPLKNYFGPAKEGIFLGNGAHDFGKAVEGGVLRSMALSVRAMAKSEVVFAVLDGGSNTDFYALGFCDHTWIRPQSALKSEASQ
jgi:hypothetical protein